MALPKLLEDLAFISKLGDYPGSDDNLTPEQFKERFDMAALRIQEYLNNQLIPGLDQLVDVQALLTSILDSTLSFADKAANAKATGDALEKKLDKTGGTVTGSIDMSGKGIANVADPVTDGDAVNKKFLSEYVATVQVPMTLLASGWSEAEPYTQTVQVSGLSDLMRCEVFPAWPESAETEEALHEETMKVSSCRRSGDQLTFRCLKDKPKSDIPIVVEVGV